MVKIWAEIKEKKFNEDRLPCDKEIDGDYLLLVTNV